jgi:aspartate-semialdehyde dehydrogenase
VLGEVRQPRRLRRLLPVADADDQEHGDRLAVVAHRDRAQAVREDATVENGLTLWIVSDNLLKGAALNTVQIAETIIDQKLIPNAA